MEGIGWMNYLRVIITEEIRLNSGGKEEKSLTTKAQRAQR
jgi:hypothetical protein